MTNPTFIIVEIRIPFVEKERALELIKRMGWRYELTGEQNYYSTLDIFSESH